MNRLLAALLLCAVAAPALAAKPQDQALPPIPPLPDARALPLPPEEPGGQQEPGLEAKPEPDGLQPPPGNGQPAQPAALDGGLWDAFQEGFQEGLREQQGEPLSPGEPELTDDQAAALGLGALCCCFAFLLGLIVVVVLVVKASQKKQPPPPAPLDGWRGAPGPGPVAPAAWTPQPAPAHLSVLALALDTRARATVLATLQAAGAVHSPPGPAERALLVGALCRALLGVEPSWRAFGYGEKPDLPDDRAAEASFRSAWEDFRARCRQGGTRGGEVAVAVLVLCSRGPSLGVTRLDDPAQVRDALSHRAALPGEVLLGAELLWAPEADFEGLGADEALRRFPEMQALRRLG